MTHKEESRAVRDAVEVLVESGSKGMAEAMQILFHEAMKAERSVSLRAEPYQRTTDRRGHANGLKLKTVRSRVGDLELCIPQVRAAEEPLGSLMARAKSARSSGTRKHSFGVASRGWERAVDPISGQCRGIGA